MLHCIALLRAGVLPLLPGRNDIFLCVAKKPSSMKEWMVFVMCLAFI